MQWIADRFFRTDDAWIDAASGSAVRLRLLPAAKENQLAWSEECARLSLLRHPLLNALVDYGPAARGLLFEAFAPGEAVHATAGEGSADRLFQQVTQFLRSHEITMPPDRAVHAMRAMVAGRGAPRRAVGLTLQGRRALSAIEEVLDEMSPAGAVVVTVSGAPHTGLRTLRCLVARAARLRGFTVIGATALDRFPPIRSLIGTRHICLLDDVADPGRVAERVSGVLNDLSLASARRHVVVRFSRDASRTRGIPLDPLDPARLVAMVFRDRDEPGDAELRAAAREAHGLPGAFVARLCGGAYPTSAAPLLVHETSPVYGAGTTAAEPAIIAGRVLGAALRASDRAGTLARCGRHAAARRLLERAIRVLDGRDRRVESARCQIQLGLLALDRGATAQARARFDRARALDVDAGLAVDATIGAGVALTDERRLVEGEAVLRGAVAAADTLQDRDRAATAAAMLARCLFWQGRQEEAIATASAHLETPPGPRAAARLLGVRARAQARLGRTALAVRTARDAQQLAAQADPRTQSSTELALAEALASGGDLEGARAAVARATRLARLHHQPLQRVRGLLIASSCGVPGAARALVRLRRLPLPALLADRLARAAEPPPRRVEPVTIVEQLLDLSQRAADDGTALTAICGATAERLRACTVCVFSADERVLASHGRGWPAPALIVQQVLAQAGSHVSRMSAEPQEAAEPIRFGGETIGVLACRWTAGTVVEAEGAAVFMRAAALTVAPHLRACLEMTPLPPAAWGDLIGESPAALDLRQSVSRAARAPFPVLIEGESGCGKELVARAIHRLGPRCHRRFCALNCAALTDELIETELFGHVRGAFTGAAAERAGLFEEADGGTLFLDEVGELSPRAQAKLLRVLQEGEVRRVGENLPRKVDVRVVAATNRQIAEEVKAGRFRADLRFRLDVVRIPVPPLRARASDVPLLAAHFWRDAAARVGSRAALSKEALVALSRYDWPGNVRELQNVIAWIAVHSPRRGRVGASALPAHIAQSTTGPHITFEAARQDFERRFVRAALAGANGQRARAAEVLGVTRQGLAKMMKRLSIEG